MHFQRVFCYKGRDFHTTSFFRNPVNNLITFRRFFLLFHSLAFGFFFTLQYVNVYTVFTLVSFNDFCFCSSIITTFFLVQTVSSHTSSQTILFYSFFSVSFCFVNCCCVVDQIVSFAFVFSHGWSKHSLAVARLSGSNSSIGRKKSANCVASLMDHSYFCMSTSSSPHGFSPVMWRSSPFLLNTKCDSVPEKMIFFGIGPNNSIICAMWSSSRQ